MIKAAVEKAGGGPPVLIGDTTWACQAAERAAVKTIALLTGGYSEQALRSAGAACVLALLAGLRAQLDETPLSAG